MAKSIIKVENLKSKSAIKVENLKVSFKDAKNKKNLIEIIRGVSFEIKKGEITGFIGESGSGKSVTARSLFGMNTNSKTTAETLLISGVNMIKKNSIEVFSKNKYWKKIRGKKVTYIPQNPMTSLNPTMRIHKQVLEVMDITKKYEKFSKKAKMKVIVDLFEEFGISNAAQRIKAYPHEFSGGMRQRVVIAMAVISRPDVIIADEPTTALDPTIQASVLELLKNIATKYNVGIIFVSHDISVISTLCDYVNVFYAGKIVERAKTFDLFTNSKHPYTWALLSSMPKSNKDEDLYTLDGSPPNFAALPSGDPFSVRNKYSLQVDFRKEPLLFSVTGDKDHQAATWLLHPNAPSVEPPKQVIELAQQIKKDLKNVEK